MISECFPTSSYGCHVNAMYLFNRYIITHSVKSYGVDSLHRYFLGQIKIRLVLNVKGNKGMINFLKLSKNWTVQFHIYIILILINFVVFIAISC